MGAKVILQFSNSPILQCRSCIVKCSLPVLSFANNALSSFLPFPSRFSKPLSQSNQSTSQPVNQSTSQLLNAPFPILFPNPTNQRTNEPTNQRTNEPTNQRTNEPYLRGQNFPLSKIRVAAVSYLNTKPLLWGVERSPVVDEMELLLDYPANLAQSLKDGSIDMALLPVAAMPGIPGARIVSDYGIAADGEVASVCIFSEVPMEEITSVYLDYQSRSSVKLATLLLKKWWKRDVRLLPAPEDYISKIQGATAGVIIGDRALKQRPNFSYVYDLATAWMDWTALPFVFAAWVANKDLPQDFLERFNAANREGLAHIDEVIAEHPFPHYDMQQYYRHNIQYVLDDEKKRGLTRFLSEIQSLAD